MRFLIPSINCHKIFSIEKIYTYSMPSTVKKVVKGTTNRVTGSVTTVFDTLGSVLGRARNAAVGTVHIAKDIVTLDAKNLRKDVRKVGRSAVGAVGNVATGAVKTVRVAVTGKKGPSAKKTKTSRKSR
jgi:phage-related protein